MEVPSHLFEYFASDPELLQRWGRHHVTGLPAPPGFFDDALVQRRTTEILEVQAQLLYALCDQMAFGEGMGDLCGGLEGGSRSSSSSSSSSSEEVVFDRLVEGAAELQLRHAPSLLLAPHVGGGGVNSSSSAAAAGLPDLHLLNHSHFVTYGGSYYSYLFAKMCVPCLLSLTLSLSHSLTHSLTRAYIFLLCFSASIRSFVIIA